MKNLEYIIEEVDRYTRNLLLEYIPKDYNCDDYCNVTDCEECPFNSTDYLTAYICAILMGE